ncbi:MAG: hypothetical protein DCC58_10545 [Chloroflexi bacterium]|nr:MAG: hypothetical protein DCC58_10545 [Chloroflexota bacterium]
MLLDAPPVLYGRASERAALQSALATAMAGRGSLALLAGEAGIGKTALVDALAADAWEQGVLTLRGHCYDSTVTPAYGPWRELLGGAPRTAAVAAPGELLGQGGANPSPASQEAQFAAVVRYLGALATQRPLLLVLEDQHWADADSLHLLRVLARALPSAPTLLVVTYRDVDLASGDPLYRTLPMLVREARPQRLTLRRLGRESIGELVDARYPLPQAERERLVDHLLANAEGNPFFTEEILRTLEHEQLLTRHGDHWELGDLAQAHVPHLVRQMIDSRVDRLDDNARRLLHVAAVIGSDVPLDLWAQAAGVSDEDLAPVVERALQAQLLAESTQPATLRFPHAIVREAIYESMILPRRHAWHRRIGEVIAAQPQPDPDAAAHHFQRARDPRAAEWLVRSGERASRANAIQDAVDRYEQALQLLEGDDQALFQRVRLLCNLAGAYRYTNPARALADLDRARDLADRMDDRTLAAVVRWNRARIRGFLAEDTRADIDQAIAAYHALTAEERQRVRELGRGVAGSQGALAQWLAHHGRYQDALAIGEDCLAQPEASPEDDGIERGHALLGVALSQAGLGRPEKARATFAAARQQFDRLAYHFMTAAAIKWELLEDALPFQPYNTERIARLVAEYGRVWLQTGGFTARDGDEPLFPLYPPLLLAGHWEEARRAALAYVGDAYLRIDALAALAEIARARGEHSAAWDDIQQAFPNGPETSFGTPFFVRSLALQRCAAELALDEGRPDVALAWIDAHDRWLDAAARVLNRSEAATLRARHAELRGDLGQAAHLAQQACDLARHPRQPLALLTAARAVGRIARLQGRHSAAATALHDALELADACSAPYEQALTLLELAELTQQQPDEAAAYTERAATLARALGAQPLLARISTQQAAAPATAAPSASAHDLSPRELDVLRLVARGLTDADVAAQLHISRRTVAGHLQSIYGKLGVSSRTAAAAWAFERQLLE